MKIASGRRLWLGLVVLLALGCGDDGATDPGPGPGPDPDPDPAEPVYISGQVRGLGANVLSAEVTVSARDYDELVVRASRAGDAPLETPAVAFDGETTASTAVLGLHADSEYSLEIVLSADGIADVVDTLLYTTGPLPDWLPSIAPVGADPAPGFLVLSAPGGPVIIDNTGRVVWYVTAPDPVLSSFQAHPDGSYTLLGRDTEVQEFGVLDELGNEVGRMACVGWDETRFHEIRVEANGSYWVMCHDRRVADLTDVGGLPEVELDWTVVQHVSATGSLLWEWRSADHFDITDVGAETIDGASAINVTHGNAIAFDTDGNLLVSFRELDEVTKIDAETGEVIWRFGGGLRNQFNFVNDPKGSFERQHGLRVVESGVIQLLDNGDAVPSRLVRYRIDEQTMTAELLFEFIDSPETYTPVGGGTDVLPDGGALVSFGRAGRVVEVSASGDRRWELTGIDQLYVFRAQRIPSLYASERKN
ncbi:MAG: aryl-sulfate sulfotransferase [Gemmatimonadota bacterium]